MIEVNKIFWINNWTVPIFVQRGVLWNWAGRQELRIVAVNLLTLTVCNGLQSFRKFVQ